MSLLGPAGGGVAAAGGGVDDQSPSECEDNADLERSLVQSGPAGGGADDGGRTPRSSALSGHSTRGKVAFALVLSLAVAAAAALAAYAAAAAAAAGGGGAGHSEPPSAGLEQKWDTSGGGLQDDSVPQVQLFAAKQGWMQHGHVMESIKQADTDGDGELDSKELAALDEVLEARLHISSAAFYRTLDECDSNMDGKLGKLEVPLLLKGLGKEAAISQRFDRLDEDHNGKMEGEELADLEELLREQAGLSQADFQRALEEADEDGDGVLARDEASAFVRAMMRYEATFEEKFQKLDLDGSGDLEADELQALARKMRRRFGISEASFQEHFEAADSNGNKRLERSEVEGLLQSARDAALAPWRFHKLDRDSDGEVQGEEIEELASRMQAELGLLPDAAEEVLEGADSNSDGALQSGEGPGFLRLLWQRKLGKG